MTCIKPVCKGGIIWSGMIYREMELSKKLPNMGEDEQIKLLASDGMLVKTPLAVGDGYVLVGFKETEWTEGLSGCAKKIPR